MSGTRSRGRKGGGVDEEVTKQTDPHRAIPNSTLDEAGEVPAELPPPLNGEGTPNPRPLIPPPIPDVINVGLFNPEVTPKSDVVGPLFL